MVLVAVLLLPDDEEVVAELDATCFSALIIDLSNVCCCSVPLVL
jgi:hypothetical protein